MRHSICLSAPRVLLAAGLGFLSALGCAQTPEGRPAAGTISRISMVAARPEVTERFYREVLGFRLVSEGVVGGETGAAMIAKAWNLKPGARMHGIVLCTPRGDTELQITYVVGQSLRPVRRRPTAAPLAGDHYFTLYVHGLDEMVKRMAYFRTPFHRGPMVMQSLDRNGRPYSVYEAVVSDPEGTVLILVDDERRG